MQLNSKPRRKGPCFRAKNARAVAMSPQSLSAVIGDLIGYCRIGIGFQQRFERILNQLEVFSRRSLSSPR